MTIQIYDGTVGSGKSYHALEDIVEFLRKGGHVIANFPLTFSSNHITNGMADRFLYIPDSILTGESGMSLLYNISMDYDFYGNEGACMVVIDEAGEYFPQAEDRKPEQLKWKLFFTQSRKLGYDFTLIVQDDKSINRTIRKCVEYQVTHRKANNIFPFKYLPFTLFMHVKHWNKGARKERLGSSSTMYVKRLGDMYDTYALFSDIDQKLELDVAEKEMLNEVYFGNLVKDDQREQALQKRKMGLKFWLKRNKNVS